jgi:cytochrome c oxidase assembly protein subunit 15
VDLKVMTTDNGQRTTDKGRWLHRWAMLTFVATLPLLLLGAEVTTKKVGMVDQVGFRAPWHLLTVAWQEKGLGFLIEHAHRLAGFVVGTCAIVLCVALWLRERRRWVRWLGAAALAGVSAQGVLGILRVNLNARVGPELAMIHGCFAPLVVALLASLALFTSQAWAGPDRVSLTSRDTARISRLSLVTAGLIYLQVVLGAVVRHQDLPLGARAHLLVAFAAVAAVVWLVKTVLDSRIRGLLRQTTLLLPLLVVLQLLLGVEAWMSKFASPQWQQLRPLPVQATLVRSIHSLGGTLLLACAVVVALQALRLWSLVSGEERLDGFVGRAEHAPHTTHHSRAGVA